MVSVSVFTGLATFFSPAIAHAAPPFASQLLADSNYDVNYSPGVRVYIDNPAFYMAGLANDGTTAYMLDGSSGNVVTVPLSSISMAPGGSVHLNGTVHSVGWGVNGAPALPSNLYRLSIVYSHGCLFITDGVNTTNAQLRCISTSDYKVSNVPVPASYLLPVGSSYTFSSLIDFPDGRIGKVSAYASDGSGGYLSTLRTYTISGTGNSATIAWSQDYQMADTANWATDEHGIATDGTYLYRIQWWQISPANYKSWALQSSGAAPVLFQGNFTRPFPNMHYLSHNHAANYYMAGFFNQTPYTTANTGFFITASADPGPGPGNPLTPRYGTVSPTADGYTVQITNYDPAFNWTGSATAGGRVTISSSGLMTVTGLSAGQSSAVTVTAARAGYPSGAAGVTGTALAAATTSNATALPGAPDTGLNPRSTAMPWIIITAAVALLVAVRRSTRGRHEDA